MVQLAGNLDNVILDDPDLPFLMAARHADVDAEYGRRIGLGFPWNFGTPSAPIMETLQLATDTDRTNWLGLMIGCQLAIAEGGGGNPVDPPIRCTSNRQYTPNISDVPAILASLNAWAGSLLKDAWALKNTIDACTSAEDVHNVAVTDDASWSY